MDRKQITLRLPGKMYEALKDISVDVGLPLHALIILAINQELGRL